MTSVWWTPKALPSTLGSFSADYRGWVPPENGRSQHPWVLGFMETSCLLPTLGTPSQLLPPEPLQKRNWNGAQRICKQELSSTPTMGSAITTKHFPIRIQPEACERFWADGSLQLKRLKKRSKMTRWFKKANTVSEPLCPTSPPHPALVPFLFLF